MKKQVVGQEMRTAVESMATKILLLLQGLSACEQSGSASQKLAKNVVQAALH
jgi:hypothetical protein